MRARRLRPRRRAIPVLASRQVSHQGRLPLPEVLGPRQALKTPNHSRPEVKMYLLKPFFSGTIVFFPDLTSSEIKLISIPRKVTIPHFRNCWKKKEIHKSFKNIPFFHFFSSVCSF